LTNFNKNSHIHRINVFTKYNVFVFKFWQISWRRATLSTYFLNGPRIWNTRCGFHLKVFLFIFCFTFRSKIFHSYGDATIADERLQNLGLCSALRAFDQEGIFIVPHLRWHGASVFRPIQSPLTTHKGMWRTYSYLDPHVVNVDSISLRSCWRNWRGFMSLPWKMQCWQIALCFN
jgi:hypothetical protein